MGATGFSNSRQDCRQIFKWILLFCLFQFWVDSYRIFNLPSQNELSRSFVNNDIVFLGRNEKKRGNSNKQHENIEESRLLTAGKTPLFLAKLFKLDQEKEGRSSYGFKPRTTKNFYTTQARTREKVSRHHKPKTSVRLQKKITRKDFVFKDIIDNERLNSYAVESTQEEHRGLTWYVLIVSGVVVLLVVVALCVHAPCGCLWRRHQREHHGGCPIAGSHKGMCGKCFLHNRTTTKTMTFEERPYHVSVTMASNESCHRPSSGDYSSKQYTWAYNTHQPGKLSQAKSKVSSLLKGSQGSSHCLEPEAGYRYRPLKNKRDSLHSMYDPEWTSAGAFLNKNRPSSSYLGYGSTKESDKKFVDRYCRRSRDSLDAAGDTVEYALRLRPRRRQVIELQEFPLGYSKSFLNIDLESDPGVVFDPYRDQLQRKSRGRKFDRLTFSDSDLRQLSCTDKLGNYDSNGDLFGASKPRKSSLKTATTRGKTNSKVVHFFPSNFSYDAQFVQIPPKNKMESNVGEFERRFNLSYCKPNATSLEVLDAKIRHSADSKPAMSGDASEVSKLSQRTMGIGYYGKNRTDDKEHAVDVDLKSPTMEEATDDGNSAQTRDCASSYVNCGCRSSTEELMGSKEKLASNQESQSLCASIDSEKKEARSLESISCSLEDLYESDMNYKAEPLAGLMSPIRRVTRYNEGITCVPVALYADRSSPNVMRIYQPQPDDTRIWKPKQSQNQTEKDVWCMGKMPYYEQIQQIPEKETEKTEQ